MRTRSFAILLLLAASTGLYADAVRDAATAKFKQADKNGDGVITPDELPLPRIFKFLDRNGDGKITLDEAIAAAPTAAAAARDGTLAAIGAEPAVLPPGPRAISAGEAGIGRRIGDLALTDLDGKTRPLSQLFGKNGAVFAFTSTTCPVSKRYAPGLARLEGTLREKGIALVLVDPFASDKPEALRAMVQENKLTAPVVMDRDGAIVKALQGHTSTEVFLVDAKRTLLYRGALDDQYGLNYSQDAPQQTYLLDAVATMLGGHKIVVAATTAPGCELETAAPASAATAAVTYHSDVQRILQQNCAECHHEGGVGPFSLEDLAEVKDHAKVIRRVVEQGTMPPWFATPGEAGQPSPWANDRSLSAESKRELLAWLDSKDRPLGQEGEAPQPIKWPDGWTLGEPDAVLAFDKAVPVKAEGTMAYVNVVVPTNFPEDRWISAAEVLPGQREVVHHVVVTMAAKDGGRQHEGAGFSYFALYVPGTSVERAPAGMAKKLPAGATLRFQMHYTPNGKATEDLTRIGFYFTKEEPKWEIHTASAMNVRINIPAGDANHMETAQLTLPPNVLVLSLFPHMHVRGKAFKYELLQADGSSRTLLEVPRYDFNWQLSYLFAEPFISTPGMVLKATAWYDNSAGNKANPDPSKDVRWGEQTSQEMMIGSIRYAVPIKPLPGTAQR